MERTVPSPPYHWILDGTPKWMPLNVGFPKAMGSAKDDEKSKAAVKQMLEAVKSMMGLCCRFRTEGRQGVTIVSQTATGRQSKRWNVCLRQEKR